MRLLSLLRGPRRRVGTGVGLKLWAFLTGRTLGRSGGPNGAAKNAARAYPSSPIGSCSGSAWRDLLAVGVPRGDG
ncbi:MAG: hypothetical protein JWM05_2385 [Acidimicrobiales bacterium]|nr:hypothetical protein [Acidimicrobiales bacterium]